MENMKERMAELQRLRKEHGGYEAIPEDALQAIEYIRHTDENGVLEVIPVEVFAQRSLAHSIERKERRLVPLFDELRLDVYTREEYATTVPPKVFIRENDDLFEDMEQYVAGTPEVRRSIYAQRYDVARMVFGAQLFGDNRDFIWPDYSHVVDDTISRLDASSNDPSYAMIMRDYLDLSEGDERYSSGTSEDIWEGLERIKSGLADPEILDTITREQYGLFVDVLSDEEGTDIPAFHARLADILRSGGIETVAHHIETAETIDDARRVVASALESNTAVDDFKNAEKGLKTQMRSAATEQERHTINREIHALKAKRKDAVQIVHGVNALLHPAETYTDYVKSRIKKLQAYFVNESDKPITLTFDGKPDAQKDSDPGKMSGDCTEGAPLPFDKNVGAYNIKVSLEQRYMGNVYLLDTTDAEGNHVWHLDAIQIPTVRVDWHSAFKEVIDTFGVSARDNDVSMITINDRSELISNYDYIGEAGTAMIDTLKYEGRSRAVSVQFPESFSDNTDFQGSSTDQYAVWVKPE